MQRVALAVCVLLLCAFGARTGETLAAWTDPQSVGTNAFSTVTVSAPASLTATASCSGTATAKIVLNWPVISVANGYDVSRGTSSGGPYTFLAHATTNTYTNNGLGLVRTYHYVVKSTRSTWTSGNSPQASATTPAVCV